MNEMVNHPAHYNAPGRKECIEEMIDKWGEGAVAMWCEMTAYKYEYRAGTKEGESAERDNAKREWYLNKAKELYCHLRRKGPFADSVAAALSNPLAADIAAPVLKDVSNPILEQIQEDIKKQLYGHLYAGLPGA